MFLDILAGIPSIFRPMSIRQTTVVLLILLSLVTIQDTFDSLTEIGVECTVHFTEYEQTQPVTAQISKYFLGKSPLKADICKYGSLLELVNDSVSMFISVYGLIVLSAGIPKIGNILMLTVMIGIRFLETGFYAYVNASELRKHSDAGAAAKTAEDSTFSNRGELMDDFVLELLCSILCLLCILSLLCYKEDLEKGGTGDSGVGTNADVMALIATNRQPTVLFATSFFGFLPLQEGALISVVSIGLLSFMLCVVSVIRLTMWSGKLQAFTITNGLYGISGLLLSVALIAYGGIQTWTLLGKGKIKRVRRTTVVTGVLLLGTLSVTCLNIFSILMEFPVFVIHSLWLDYCLLSIMSSLLLINIWMFHSIKIIQSLGGTGSENKQEAANIARLELIN
jgi:hypothetical protein